MKDDHLIAALRRALARYGSPELPPDAADDVAHRTRRPARNGGSRARTPGWVSIGEIEASQPPNSYPRLGRREIKARCRELAAAPDAPVAQVRSLGLRTWVRVAVPSLGDAGSASGAQPATTSPATESAASGALTHDAPVHDPTSEDSAGKDVQGPRRGQDDDSRTDLGEPDLRRVGDVDEPATLPDDVDLDLPDRS